MLFLQATYPCFLALASPDSFVTYIGYQSLGAICSPFRSFNVQGPHEYHYQKGDRNCPISSLLHKLISNLDHALLTRGDASGTIGTALSLKDSGWPNGILWMPWFLENKICSPSCNFVVQILRVAGPFVCSCIPRSCLQITSDNVCSCKYSRDSCRLTLVQVEDQDTHHPPSRNGSSIQKALLVIDHEGKTIHLSQGKMLFSSSAITAITLSVCLIAGTIAELIPKPDLLINVAIADGAIHDPVHGAWAREPRYFTQSAKKASDFRHMDEHRELQEENRGRCEH